MKGSIADFEEHSIAESALPFVEDCLQILYIFGVKLPVKPKLHTIVHIRAGRNEGDAEGPEVEFDDVVFFGFMLLFLRVNFLRDGDQPMLRQRGDLLTRWNEEEEDECLSDDDGADECCEQQLADEAATFGMPASFAFSP